MNHLSEEIQTIARLSDDIRIKRILSYKWIGYTKALHVLKKMEFLLIHPKVPRMPNLLLHSNTANGKTILLQRFFKRHHPKKYSTREKKRMPVVYTQAPYKPDERMFFIGLLDKLKAPYNVKEKNIVMLNQQVINVFRTAETKILIIDEIHHVLAGTLLIQRVFLNMIKFLANELQIVIIVSGTRDALAAINADKQLANRFEPVSLPLWNMNEEYLKLLSSFEALLPLRKPSNLTQEELAFKILSLSGGTIGEISQIIRNAAVEAILSKKEHIDLATLSHIDYAPPEGRQREYESPLP
jgi:hypothetical protein